MVADYEDCDRIQRSDLFADSAQPLHRLAGLVSITPITLARKRTASDMEMVKMSDRQQTHSDSRCVGR